MYTVHGVGLQQKSLNYFLRAAWTWQLVKHPAVDHWSIIDWSVTSYVKVTHSERARGGHFEHLINVLLLHYAFYYDVSLKVYDDSDDI